MARSKLPNADLIFNTLMAAWTLGHLIILAYLGYQIAR
jgi:hypothetical protein